MIVRPAVDVLSYESLLGAMEGVAFVTDTDGTIAAVGERNWNASARRYGVAAFEASTVLGRSLFEFVAGVDVEKALRKVMIEAAMEPDAVVVMPLYCDSPDERHSLRQSIRPIFSGESCGGIVFQSIELDARARPPIALFDAERTASPCGTDETLPILVMCSWCRRVRFPPTGGDDWIEAEAYYASGGTSRVSLSHSICERCSERIGV